MHQESLYILVTFPYLLQAIIMPATFPRRVEFCQILVVLCAKDDCGGGPEYEFVVRVTGGDSKVKSSYRWNISSGRIIEGEGTRRIKVDASGSEENCLTVRAEVNGYHPGCDHKAAPLKVCRTLATPDKRLQLTTR